MYEINNSLQNSNYIFKQQYKLQSIWKAVLLQALTDACSQSKKKLSHALKEMH
ncbi:hypothetical protein Fokcrypt_00357 [Candidatus Fokinia cryptica]|uniref:Uncharacterized protein n=1 Tax=Candidatus Fokinia crypta TaxID=1920990 RepID=A0ABZ0UUS2_9RICK|nr:hypothetical protein Fokcrypt_00357 [Candidatus Fokinia cryptica]